MIKIKYFILFPIVLCVVLDFIDNVRVNGDPGTDFSKNQQTHQNKEAPWFKLRGGGRGIWGCEKNQEMGS